MNVTIVPPASAFRVSARDLSTITACVDEHLLYRVTSAVYPVHLDDHAC